MNYEARRSRVLDSMEDNSMLLLYSGQPQHISSDAYCDFISDRHFFYLTGLTQENTVLMMMRCGEVRRTTLYIEQADPAMERWTGKMLTAEQAQQLTGIQDVRFTDRFEREVEYLLSAAGIGTCYFNCYRHQPSDLPDYNLAKAASFAAAHPGIAVKDLWHTVSRMRMEKDADEVSKLRQAIDITGQGLEYVMQTLKPGMKEYQAQAAFEYRIRYLGADGLSFPTIAGSGKNGTMLHYETNRETCQDGTLLLLDLGAKLDGYCADITRTYPVNGKFTQRQRQVYDIVLRANRRVAREAKPGMTTRELNDICKKVLAEGCVELGLIRDESEIGKYYMHGVSHHLGIDVHDVTVDGVKLLPGCVITDEPGLYIDEWEIGIRIEDDLLITEDGCVCLSENIIRDPEEIQRFMAKG